MSIFVVVYSATRPSGLIECDQLIGPRHAEELPFRVQLKGEKKYTQTPLLHTRGVVLTHIEIRRRFEEGLDIFGGEKSKISLLQI